MDNASIWYVNIFVTNFQNALAFYRDTSPAKQPGEDTWRCLKTPMVTFSIWINWEMNHDCK